MTQTGTGALLWLDDIRPAPPGWVWVQSVNAAIDLLRSGTIAAASLDHDMGEFEPDGGDGIRLVDWMAENNVWPPMGVTVHSANPVGAERMLATINRYAPYAGTRRIL